MTRYIGNDQNRYKATPYWAQLPHEATEVVSGAMDYLGRILLACRCGQGASIITMHDNDGSLLGKFGHEKLNWVHGININPQNNHIFVVDGGCHAVFEFDADGNFLDFLGPEPRDELHVEGEGAKDYRDVDEKLGPFHAPTDIAFHGKCAYVTDGYLNCAVQVFDLETRKLIDSWGEPGSGDGQFMIVHSITIRGDRIYICDRANWRIQVFSIDGEFVEQLPGIVRPNAVIFDEADNMIIIEQGSVTAFFPGVAQPEPGIFSRISIYSPEGELLERWGSGENTDQVSPYVGHGAFPLCVPGGKSKSFIVTEVRPDNPYGLSKEGYSLVTRYDWVAPLDNPSS